MTSEKDQTQHTLQVADESHVRLDTCKLVQMTGDNKGTELELTSPETVIGTADECDLRVAEAAVSRRHFRIVRDEHTYSIQDLESTNGTFVDDARVKEAYLKPGSRVRAGDILFRFESLFAPEVLSPSDANSFGGVLGQSYRMREIFGVLETVAAADATIVITGETGTGKTAIARAIHQASHRAAGPFTVVDCGAITPTLVESELFGHERGAFTGAIKQRAGALEASDGGTLFIDEMTDLSINLQPKLLRALEDREVIRVGNTRPIRVDCRVVAASQKDLWEEVEAERFRADLYFRLAVVTIHLPALRERREDIPLLVDHFLKDMGEERTFSELSSDLQRQLLGHDWPGNLRELRNTVERVALMHGVSPFVRPGGGNAAGAPAAANVPMAAPGTFAADLDKPFKAAKEDLLAAFERAYVTRLLERVGGSVTEAAREAGLDRKHIYNLMSKHGLSS